MPKMVREDRVTGEWQVHTLANLAGGLMTGAPADQIGDEQTPDSENLTWRGNRAKVDTGYIKFGDTVRGNVKGYFQHQDALGNNTSILVTDDTFYKYNTSKKKWHYVSDGVDTTLSAPEAAGQTVLSVIDETGFSVSDYVGLMLDDGEQHQTTVAAVAAGLVTVDDALPSDAAAGKELVKALDLSGNDNYQVVFAAVPSHQWTAFTNGVDVPLL
jgi:hypothetical protein